MHGVVYSHVCYCMYMNAHMENLISVLCALSVPNLPMCVCVNMFSHEVSSMGIYKQYKAYMIAQNLCIDDFYCFTHIHRRFLLPCTYT
jgi:hypothetical protein